MGIGVAPKLIAKRITISNTALNSNMRSGAGSALTLPRGFSSCDFFVANFIDLLGAIQDLVLRPYIINWSRCNNLVVRQRTYLDGESGPGIVDPQPGAVRDVR